MSEASDANAVGACVLVVDDNQDIRDLISFILSKEGYEVITATDGDEGLDLAISRKPNLILLDVMMPRVSGLETLTALRAHKDKSISGIPVVMITAKAATADVDEALARGADSYIVKPFRPAGLSARVHSVLNDN